MPPTRIADPTVTVKALLEGDWNAAHTLGLTPDVSTGWYDRQKDISAFRVTVTPGDEFEELAGLTEDGPAAFWDGSVDVNSWTSKRVVGTDGTQIGNALAKKLAYTARQEVDRILRENQTLVSGLLVMKPVARRALPDDQESPVVFRWLVEANYKWIEVPA